MGALIGKGGASCNGGARSIEKFIRIKALTDKNKFEGGGRSLIREGALIIWRTINQNYYGKQFSSRSLVSCQQLRRSSVI